MSLHLSRRAGVFVPIVLLIVSVLAGCISEAPGKPDRVVGQGTGGTIYVGWDYAGTTGVPLNGSITFEATDETNNGTVLAMGQMEGENITIDFSRFVHSADDFHSGGVAVHIPEHGDTGHGDTNIPEIFALLAIWGTATVQRAGEPWLDPYTGDGNWSAHLMVTDTGIRDEADGGKVKSGAGLYSPDAAGDGVTMDDHEAILILQSMAPPGDLNVTNESFEGSVGQPSAAPYTLPFAVQAIGSTISLTVDFGQDPQEAGPYAVRILDPDGGVIQQRALAGTNQNTKSVTIETVADTMGNHTIEVRSTLGIPGGFTGALTVTPPPRPLYWFHWESVEVSEGGR